MKLSVMIALLTFILSIVSHAGWREVGNGGGACVCRDDNDEITEAKSSDLALLEAFNKKTISSIGENENIILRNIFSSDLKFLNYIIEIGKPKKIEFLPPKAKLTYIQDFVMYACKNKDDKKNKCAYEQLANFTFDNVLYISNDIYKSEKFSLIDKAALLAHEHIYSFDRIFNNSENSNNTKKFVRLLFDQDRNTSEIYRFATENFYALDFAILNDDVDFVKKLYESQVDLSIAYLEKVKYFDKILFFRAINVLDYILKINKDSLSTFSTDIANYLFYIIPNNKKYLNLASNLYKLSKPTLTKDIFHVLVDLEAKDLITKAIFDFDIDYNLQENFVKNLYLKFENYKELTNISKIYSSIIEEKRKFNYTQLRDIKYPYTSLNPISIAVIKHNNDLLKTLVESKRIPYYNFITGDLGGPCATSVMLNYNSYLNYLRCELK